MVSFAFKVASGAMIRVFALTFSFANLAFTPPLKLISFAKFSPNSFLRISLFIAASLAKI